MSFDIYIYRKKLKMINFDYKLFYVVCFMFVLYIYFFLILILFCDDVDVI